MPIFDRFRLYRRARSAASADFQQRYVFLLLFTNIAIATCFLDDKNLFFRLHSSWKLEWQKERFKKVCFTLFLHSYCSRMIVDIAGEL